ncbi:MAG: hypothetical protein EB015_22235 [Methylocystaceae bacterium]|nr:hypothetical protein [Methylocystaceae bacterium]
MAWFGWVRDEGSNFLYFLRGLLAASKSALVFLKRRNGIFEAAKAALGSFSKRLQARYAGGAASRSA